MTMFIKGNEWQRQKCEGEGKTPSSNMKSRLTLRHQHENISMKTITLKLENLNKKNNKRKNGKRAYSGLASAAFAVGDGTEAGCDRHTRNAKHVSLSGMISSSTYASPNALAANWNTHGKTQQADCW